MLLNQPTESLTGRNQNHQTYSYISMHLSRLKYSSVLFPGCSFVRVASDSRIQNEQRPTDCDLLHQFFFRREEVPWEGDFSLPVHPAAIAWPDLACLDIQRTFLHWDIPDKSPSRFPRMESGRTGIVLNLGITMQFPFLLTPTNTGHNSLIVISRPTRAAFIFVLPCII